MEFTAGVGSDVKRLSISYQTRTIRNAALNASIRSPFMRVVSTRSGSGCGRGSGSGCVCSSVCYYYALRYRCVVAGLTRLISSTSLSGSAAAAASAAVGLNQPVIAMHSNKVSFDASHRSLTVLCAYCAVPRQVATSNAVFLHPQSSECADAMAAKARQWKKRKSKKRRKCKAGTSYVLCSSVRFG